jgi:hypothetical protein
MSDDDEPVSVRSGWAARLLSELPEQQQEQKEIVAAVDVLEKVIGAVDAHSWVDASATNDEVLIYVVSLGLLYRLSAQARSSVRHLHEPDGGIVKVVRWTIRPDDEYLLSIEYSDKPPGRPVTKHRWSFTLDRQKEKLGVEAEVDEPGDEFALQLAREIDRLRRSEGA